MDTHRYSYHLSFTDNQPLLKGMEVFKTVFQKGGFHLTKIRKTD